MGDLTTHWSKAELACKCGCGLFVKDLELIDLIERIRTHLNVPLNCNSGTRCQWNNAKAGGVVAVKYFIPGTKNLDLTKYPKGKMGTKKDSNHTTGEAADLSNPNISSKELHAKILSFYQMGGIPMLGGLGLYIKKNFVHVDVTRASDGHLRRWTE